MDDLVVICTGGRDYTDLNTVFKTLNTVFAHAKSKNKKLRVRHGGAIGLDSIVDHWCMNGPHREDVVVERMPANWKDDGKAAGPIRNESMAKLGADYVIAFPGGVGTAHMVRMADKYGIKLIKVK